VLVYGADEIDALHVVDSLGITGDVALSIATSSDLLVGPALRLEDEVLSATGERRKLCLPAGDDDTATFAAAQGAVSTHSQ
jgi:hypothetical protein